ncbi:family 20 glycosylhydrolase [Rapidithrix thailandica]|uniref:Family 20 glycosylhydrolase n=1 Tax=Rapidithrix thailandica TaxID=413964 RepID=A0AAW9S879_9BACT
MKKIILTLLVPFLTSLLAFAQSTLPVNGFCIAAPSANKVDEFVKFIENELAPRGVNTLVLRVDFNYTYESRPELRGNNPLSKEQVKQLVKACQKHQIDIIPQVNLLGHQSWAEKTNKLLEVYPEFDETPHVKMPEKYEWPNEDGLYCKSYCPQHPEVHKVVFDLMDEIIEVFEAKAFHAGMDEVFYLADDQCPRCKGMDPAALFAGEVSKLSQHLSRRGARLWIWGDRLIDGKATGIGMWEASMNNTARAIDRIPKSVVICDWHYEKAVPTPVYFAMKGFDVIVCPWRKPEVAKAQVQMMHNFRENSTPEMKQHFLGAMQTIWSPAEAFLANYYGNNATPNEKGSQVECFKAMTDEIKALGKMK